MDGQTASAFKKRESPRWLVTFADMMTLLVALFVMLLSFAEIDSDSFRRNAGPISEAFNIIPIAPTLPKSQRQDLRMGPSDAELRALQKAKLRALQKEEFLDNLRTQMSREIAEAQVEVLEKGDQIIVRFPARSAFPSGSMELSPMILPALDKIARVLLVENKGQILVSGHTDNTPISTERIRSNWDLSTQRAVSVVHHLLESAVIDPARITAQGFADSRPLEPNDTPERRARNRRVEISISFASGEDGKP